MLRRFYIIPACALLARGYYLVEDGGLLMLAAGALIALGWIANSLAVSARHRKPDTELKLSGVVTSFEQATLPIDLAALDTIESRPAPVEDEPNKQEPNEFALALKCGLGFLIGYFPLNTMWRTAIFAGLSAVAIWFALVQVVAWRKSHNPLDCDKCCHREAERIGRVQ